MTLKIKIVLCILFFTKFTTFANVITGEKLIPYNEAYRKPTTYRNGQRWDSDVAPSVPACHNVEKNLNRLLDKLEIPKREQLLKELHSICHEWETTPLCRRYSNKLSWHKFMVYQCNSEGFVPTAEQQCIEKAMPPGTGRLLNYCASDSLKTGDLFHGMANLICVHVLLRNLVHGSSYKTRDYVSEATKFERELMGIVQKCTRATRADPMLQNGTPATSSGSTGGIIFWIVGSVIVVLTVVIVVPLCHHFMAPSTETRDKTSVDVKPVE